jgi:hypothetical protein
MSEKKKDRKWEYLYETFDEVPSAFTDKFNIYLNAKGEEGWELVQHSFCHDQSSGSMRNYASCLFKRKKGQTD